MTNIPADIAKIAEDVYNSCEYCGSDVIIDTIAEALLAERNRHAGTGGQVKPLEWHGPDYEGEYWAAWIGGKYTILAKNGNGHWLGGVGGYFQTIEAAKAAAQSDYEARILSALSHPAPQAETQAVETCPVCAEAFESTDICATDIELGICHAECLEGSPVVNLDTGEPTSGPVATFTFDPAAPQANADAVIEACAKIADAEAQRLIAISKFPSAATDVLPINATEKLREAILARAGTCAQIAADIRALRATNTTEGGE